jgi:hypothetical protein
MAAQSCELYAQRTQQINQYNELLETKAMLKEDLNGRLLQRAELVAFKEEQEELIENHQRMEPVLFQLGQKQALLEQEKSKLN